VFVLAEGSEDQDRLSETVSKVVGNVALCTVSDTERVIATSEDELPTGEQSKDDSTILQINTSTKTAESKVKLHNLLCVISRVCDRRVNYFPWVKHDSVAVITK
jgi:hypothetical protein